VRLQAKWSPTYINTITKGVWCDPFWAGRWAKGDSAFVHEFDGTVGLTDTFGQDADFDVATHLESSSGQKLYWDLRGTSNQFGDCEIWTEDVKSPNLHRWFARVRGPQTSTY
jgi:hypothetical protein